MNIHDKSIGKFTDDEIISIDKISHMVNKSGMNKNSYDRWFLLAFKFLLDKNWKRRQKKLALDANLTEGFISDIKNGKNFPSRDTQVIIAEKMGYPNFDDFLSVGKKIESDFEIEQKNKNIESNNRPNNIHLFPVKINEDSHRNDLHRRLDAILDSGYPILISAIESNLIAFSEAVIDKKERKDMNDRLKKLENGR